MGIESVPRRFRSAFLRKTLFSYWNLPAWANKFEKYENGSFLSWLFAIRVLLASAFHSGIIPGKEK
jgi:hypothetical protein